MLYLSEDLARGLKDMICIIRQCVPGSEFYGTEKRKLRHRDLEDQLGEVLCATQEIVRNAGPGGPFADFALYGEPIPTGLPNELQ